MLWSSTKKVTQVTKRKKEESAKLNAISYTKLFLNLNLQILKIKMKKSLLTNRKLTILSCHLNTTPGTILIFNLFNNDFCEAIFIGYNLTNK
jgi:hypothetical protein